MAACRAPRASALALALGVVLSGCGGDDGSEGTRATAEKVEVSISAPADGSSVNADRVTVRGTVTPPDAEVQVLGEPAQVGNGVFAKSVALHPGENVIDVVASAPDVAPTTASVSVSRKSGDDDRRPRPERDDDDESREPSTTATPVLSSESNCGPGLTAGANTSCPFAENVRATYQQTGSGVIDVYSPTTGRTYTMYCTSGNPHVCTGGNGASVYFYDGAPTATYDTSTCGQGVSVGPNTSCGFALNVRDAFVRYGAGSLSVYSPTTGRTYEMYCSAGSPHVCTGGNNAAVYFP